MPTPSSRRPACDGAPSGSTFAPRTSAKTPSGRLIRNSARQSVPKRSAFISKPATTGPSTVERPITGPNAANALPICWGGNRSRISPNVCGTISAAESPWAARAPTSTSPDHANEQNAEDSTKPTRPRSNIRLRPNMSPSRAPAIRPTASARVYAAATHSSDEVDIARSRWMAGAATLTIVESRMFRIIADSTTAKPAHIRRGASVSVLCRAVTAGVGGSRRVVIGCSWWSGSSSGGSMSCQPR